ncbi:hypothetical protein CH373_09860 [Leptospira perolatii]|uniref:HEAT repeat domain-containing protein n=1 Tax=Leptospira perolatii TaxID=2023191 RepID=A0A2M9ZML8_9LEPT|nr:HEAT repeat domain-containing protein [Leptospira perolatii]PJZ70087.1 hypothetical protein CH360_07605 [Leptospira perolatii]PJZ73275.1 hypothetical protein CH373_09860 [Leptospira perolatii]
MNSIAKLRNSNKKIESCNKKQRIRSVLLILCLFWISYETQSAPKDLPKPKFTVEQIKKKKEVLLQILKYGTTKERAIALRELEDFPKEESGELYDQVGSILTKDPEWAMKIYAIRACNHLGLKKFEKEIISLLKYDQQDVQREAIFAIKKLKLHSAVSALTELLKTQDFTKNSNFTTALLEALSDFPEAKESSEFLADRFPEKFNDSELRAQMALYFGKVKYRPMESVLINTFKDEKEPIGLRAFSVNALGKMKSKDAIPPMRELLDKVRNLKSKNDIQDYQPLKIHIITALVSLGDKDIVEELYSFARDDDAVVRLRAIKHLADTEDPAVIEILEYKAQRDPSEKVKRAAQTALDQLRKKLAPEKDSGTEEKSDSSPTETQSKSEPKKPDQPVLEPKTDGKTESKSSPFETDSKSSKDSKITPESKPSESKANPDSKTQTSTQKTDSGTSTPESAKKKEPEKKPSKSTQEPKKQGKNPVPFADEESEELEGP